jgi:hypothetical protein
MALRMDAMKEQLLGIGLMFVITYLLRVFEISFWGSGRTVPLMNFSNDRGLRMS